MKAAIARNLDTVVMFSGLGAVGYGCWLVSEPLAFVVTGGAMIWMGLPD
jgi:hypothetical protein